MTPLRLGLGGAVALLLAAGTALLSRVPWSAEPSNDAVVRLTWRFRSDVVEACRPIPPEDQARLPVHMRRSQDCTRALRPYRLIVRLDGSELLTDSIAPGGARADRPLSLFREIPVEPGARALVVRFEPYGEGRAPGLDTVLTLDPREVAIVTLDATGELAVIAGTRLR